MFKILFVFNRKANFLKEGKRNIFHPLVNSPKLTRSETRRQKFLPDLPHAFRVSRAWAVLWGFSQATRRETDQK